MLQNETRREDAGSRPGACSDRRKRTPITIVSTFKADRVRHSGRFGQIREPSKLDLAHIRLDPEPSAAHQLPAPGPWQSSTNCLDARNCTRARPASARRAVN